MANSLHYIQDQDASITKFKEALKPGGAFLIVEYDTDISNPWIPYPVHFKRLQKLFKNAGFSFIEKINEISSKYNQSNIYSALIR